MCVTTPDDLNFPLPCQPRGSTACGKDIEPEATVAASVSPSKCQNGANNIYLRGLEVRPCFGVAGAVGMVVPGHSGSSSLSSVRFSEQAEPVNLERSAARHSFPHFPQVCQPVAICSDDCISGPLYGRDAVRV